MPIILIIVNEFLVFLAFFKAKQRTIYEVCISIKDSMIQVIQL